MKRISITWLLLLLITAGGFAQNTDALQGAVVKLDKAASVKDYESLEKEFITLAASQKSSWLPYYYAAFCNAKIGFLYKEDGERIEPYSVRGEEQLAKAQSLLDTIRQKQELAEVYTVYSMVYRTKVFINPMTYGRRYGTLSDKFMKQALQLDPQNPRALYVQAWVKYATPRMWGGDKQQARELAEKSLSRLKNGSTGVAPHWGKTEDEELLNKLK
ncbi:hypothetical protein ECE50_017690 [Chitinophaga sp. Mgbs1]|uniref:Uncharacterized protein n=1 Tax=Chitinophaga solisilvae TaxID=1233460 RepID=A0A433WKF8_9BACT|nr:hypothetical protein [Chitinophaga solisilvae]